jgi:hypothetical protein
MISEGGPINPQYRRTWVNLLGVEVDPLDASSSARAISSPRERAP